MSAVSETIKLPHFWTERQMVDRAVPILAGRGWRIRREYRRGNHGIVDVFVNLPDGGTIAIEAKVQGALAGIGQLLGYQFDFPTAALVLMISADLHSEAVDYAAERIGASIWLVEGRPAAMAPSEEEHRWRDEDAVGSYSRIMAALK